MKLGDSNTYDEYFNTLISESHQISSEVYTLPTGSKSEYRYVNDLLNDSWTEQCIEWLLCIIHADRLQLH
jgi:hypothetical protein